MQSTLKPNTVVNLHNKMYYVSFFYNFYIFNKYLDEIGSRKKIYYIKVETPIFFMITTRKKFGYSTTTSFFSLIVSKFGSYPLQHPWAAITSDVFPNTSIPLSSTIIHFPPLISIQ